MEIRMIGLEAPPAVHFIEAAKKYLRDARSWRQLGDRRRAALALDWAAAFRQEAMYRIARNAIRPQPFGDNS